MWNSFSGVLKSLYVHWVRHMEVKVPVRFEIKFRSNNLERFTLRKNAVHTDVFFRTQSSRSHSVEQVDFDYVLQKKKND